MSEYKSPVLFNGGRQQLNRTFDVARPVAAFKKGKPLRVVGERAHVAGRLQSDLAAFGAAQLDLEGIGQTTGELAL